MAGVVQADLSATIENHLLRTITRTQAHQEPFSHIYFENVFPPDVYASILEHLPDPALYTALSEYKHKRADGVSTRDVLALDDAGVAKLPPIERELWQEITRALRSIELKMAIFRKLAPDLAYRFGVAQDTVEKIVAYPKPSLYRDLDGYEIPPHPDGRAKIVTMQFYLPRDRSQVELGTALYERHFHPVRGLYSWHGRFRKVKQFPFLPNTGYAFAVSNSLGRKSWHGRETVPSGIGVRNSIITFYFANDERGY
jgi:hypothetical protein